MGLSQQNVSKHLQILHRSGVVTRRPDGANVFYALRDESTVKLLEDVVASVAGHLREMSDLAVGVPDKRSDGEEPTARGAAGAG